MNKKLSIIIPAFNEEKTVKNIIEKVLLQKTAEWQKEIIAVDDGSTDNTHSELKAVQNSSDFLIVRHSKNLGKGSALRSGLKLASGELIIIQDADLEYSPAEWPKMLEEFEKNSGVSAVYGSRELAARKRGYFLFVLGSRFLTFLINFFFNSKLTDSYTCYKLIRSDFFKNINLESRGFEIEAEITCKLLKNGAAVKEVPINYFPRTFSQGKKIKFRDGLLGIKAILKCWLLE